MKKISYYMTIIAILTACMFLFAGCTGKKSDAEIKEDVSSYLTDYLFGVTFEETNVTVEKHEKDTKNKTDNVFVNVEAENDTVTYTSEIEIIYRKGNSGWDIDDICTLSEDYTINKTEITEEDAEAKYKELYGNEPGKYELTDRETDLEAGTDVFYYTRERKAGYRTEIYDVTVAYVFSLNNGWQYDEESSTNEFVANRWGVEGKWTYSNSKSNMTLNIISLSNEEAEVEYDFKYVYTKEASYNSGFEMKHVQFDSDGVKNVELQVEGDDHLILKLHENDQNYYLNLTQYGGITFDGKYGKEDTFVFKYEDGEGYQVRDENETWEDKIYLYETMPVYVSGGKEGRIMGLSNELGKADHDGNMRKYVMSYMKEDGETEKASNTYELYGKYTRLTGKVFLVEGIKPGSKGELTIYGNGKRIYSKKAAKLTGNSYIEDFDIDITGVKELTIEMTGESQYVEKKEVILLDGIDYPVLAVSEVEAQR